jgi:hypothetical protein
MNEEWTAFFSRLIAANLMNDFIALMQGDAMRHAKSASQVGTPDDVRRDALADVRFCLSKADYAAKALMEAREKANSQAAGGFQEGGAALA